MAVSTVANPQLGFYCFERNGILLSNYRQRLHFLSGFQRTVLVLDVAGKSKRSRKVALVRAARAGGVTENEIEFKPSFEEYLKAMENIKVRREERIRKTDVEFVELSGFQGQSIAEKQIHLELDEVSRKGNLKRLDSREAQFVVRDLKSKERKGKLGELKDDTKKKWTQKKLDSKEPKMAAMDKPTDIVRDMETNERNGKLDRFKEQRIAEKHMHLKEDEVRWKGTRKRIDSKEAQLVRGLKMKERNGKLGEFEDETKKKWTRKKLDSKEAQLVVRGKSTDIMRDLKTEERNGKLGEFEDETKRKWTRKKLDSKESQMVVGGISSDIGLMLEIGGGYDKYQGNSNKMKRGLEISSMTIGNDVMDVDGSLNKNRVNHVKKFSGRSNQMLEDAEDDSLEIERAAFKSLDEFSDVCDQPRVSRVDMEERMQRLAKCLNGASIDTPEWNFSKIMRSAKIRFADYSMIRLIQILGKYGNWRRVLQVIEWIQSRERFKSYKIRNIYTAALDVLGKARRPVEALNVFHAMQQSMSSYPDLVAYHCIAVTLGQAGHIKELFDVIDSMKSPPKQKLSTGVLQKWDPRLEPDIIVYNAVLNACARRQNWEGAFWVLQQLKQQRQQPTSTTYGLVMEVMLACQKYNLVHAFFRKMQKSFIPNSLTYKVLVNTLWREGKVDEAVQAVQDMERRGIIGSSGLYYDLARCLCSSGRCLEALMQIEKICKVANKPLVVTYTGLIQACLDSGDIRSGIYIFEHMSKFCHPNLVTCNIMLKGYLDHNMLDEAIEFFQKLLQSGYDIRSNSDYKFVVLPDVHTFNLMLDACRVNHRWDDLEFVYTRMLQHGFHFNAKRHSRMLLEACRAGKVKLLEATWKYLVKVDQVPPPPLVKEMFRVKLEQGEYAAAFSSVAHLPSSDPHRFSPSFWLQFFRDNPHLSQEERLTRLIDDISTLSARNASPNLILLNLKKSCKEILGLHRHNV